MNTFNYPSTRTTTEVTVVEEEFYDENGKLTGKTKTTTTRTYQTPEYYNPWQPVISY
jgi:hypothetical protein